jgi:signal transduction histidine kinase/ActR/RegA family two-component response regulator
LDTPETKSTPKPPVHPTPEGSRETVLTLREAAVSARETADHAREDAAALREEAVCAREEAARARSELDAIMDRLREVNEHLVVANLRSQALAEEADKANHLKDEFIAMVSHELRTPLNAVLGWARMLGSKQLTTERATHAVETIERNAASMAIIIDDLLDVARIIGGTLRLTFRPVDVSAVTEEAVDLARPLASAKRIDLTYAADPSLTEVVNGDPGRLQQLIANVLTNAIKFTPEGGRVRVSLELAGSQLEVTVTDTGQGISAEFLPHVFERFRQARSGTSRQHGLGLGLAIARQLVELHGGTVDAASEGPGLGATFTIRLPVLTSDARVQPVTDAASSERRSQRLDDVRVLVVDNDADGRTLASLVLSEAGASVHAVSSVREAREALDRRRPDVLVSDIALPHEDGYALVRHIREHEAQHGGLLPAVALTGFARAEDRVRILAAGFQAHVAKPFEPIHLVVTVAGLVRDPLRMIEREGSELSQI